MKKTVCIYPEDFTTAFLHPLYEHICTSFNAVGVRYDTSGDDDPLELIFNELEDAQTVFFLGHGMSTCLYASIIDNVQLINKNNIDLLEGKRLFLLACNSNPFIKNYKLTNAIGFGFIPTSLDDVRQARVLHGIRIEDLDKKDVNCFNSALVNAFINTTTDATMVDFHLFKERLKFNISREIVQCLLKKEAPNYRTIVDELYYVYKDMIIS